MPGLFLFNHSAGYRLPEWEHFVRYYIAAVQKHKNYKEKFARCFTEQGEPKPACFSACPAGMKIPWPRIPLHVLVLAYEDLDQSAFVLYDARADWKFKADFIIARSEPGRIIGVRVGIQGQNEEERSKVEAQRDRQEQTMKRNTSVSSHWSNQTYQTLPSVQVSRVDGTAINRQGFHLFSVDAMERLMAEVDATLGRPRRKAMHIEQMLVYRPVQV